MMMTLSKKLSMNMMKHLNGEYVFFRFMFQQKSTLSLVGGREVLFSKIVASVATSATK